MTIDFTSAVDFPLMQLLKCHVCGVIVWDRLIHSDYHESAGAIVPPSGQERTVAESGITLRRAAEIYCEMWDEEAARNGMPEIAARNRRHIDGFLSFIDRIASEAPVSTSRRTGETQ